MALTKGRLVHSFVGGRTVRAVVVEATAPAEQTRAIHGLGPDAARLAAECLVANGLMAAHIKGEERLALQLQGEVPRVAVSSEITAEGALRQRVTPSDIQLGPDDSLRGVMLAIKSSAQGELYRGLSEVTNSSIEQALLGHLGGSQQVMDAVLRVGVSQNEDGRIRFAAGLLVERLPEHPVHPWITPEEFRRSFAALEAVTVSDLMTEFAFGKLCGQAVEVLDSRPLSWDCWCSRKKVEEMLAALGSETLRTLIEEDHGAEVSCHFCTKAYQFDEAALVALDQPSDR